MSLTYQVNIAQLGKLSEAEFALSILRYQMLLQSFPASVPQGTSYAPNSASVNSAKEHPLATFYKRKTNEGKASVSAFDAQRFTATKEKAGYVVQKGVETPLDVKIAVWKGRLLERGLATNEEIETVLNASDGVTYEDQEEPPAMEAGSVERGMDLL